MIRRIQKYAESHPLAFVMMVGGLFRLIAAIFSQGYGMHDDHFLIIEAAQSWVDDYDYNNWLPENRPNQNPGGHSLFYVGLHYALFSFLDMFSFLTPKANMFIVRLLHAAYSLLIILFGYKITRNLTDTKTAKQVGLVLALFWVMPNLSVRNLVEFTCIPPLMAATWFLTRRPLPALKDFALAGVMAGLAMGFRLQCVMFIGGIGLVFLGRKQIIPGLIFTLTLAVSFAVTQIGDLFIWGRPFAEVQEYIRYNLEHAYTYLTQEWYMYLLFLGGILLPPVSIFLFAGFIRSWKVNAMLVVPSLVFLLFHSYFPNKQERFILPVLPFLIMAGIIGLRSWQMNGTFTRVRKVSWQIFWVINTILLIVITPAYSKRSRVESMVFLSGQEDFQNFVVESSHKNDYLMPPLYYLEHWVSYFFVTSSYSAEALRNRLDTLESNRWPNYVLFMEEQDLDARIENFRKYFPSMKQVAVIEPSLLDRTLHWMNPNNKNERCFIYRFDIE